MKKAELAFKRFIRFLLARAAMTWGVELMAGAFQVYQFYRQGRMGRVIIMKYAAKGGGGGMTAEALYRRYLGGDEDALGALKERYGTKLTLYLDGYLCDLHEAEDLMIEAFAYLIAKRPAIRDGGFRAYLYQSARHMALRLLHKKRARNCFSLDALRRNRRPGSWWRKPCSRQNGRGSCGPAWQSCTRTTGRRCSSSILRD